MENRAHLEEQAMAKSLADRTAVITGGGNGIGREIAIEFAVQGAHVVSVDLDQTGNDQTASLIHAGGGACDPIQADVSVEDDVKQAFRLAGKADILVNNAAAWSGDGFLHEVTVEDWDRILAVSLKSVFLCSREALRYMIAHRAGVIINISSINALTGIHMAAYTAAKGGVLSLTRLLAQQYGDYGIRINTICPGTIMTESARLLHARSPGLEAELRSLYPASRFGTPADVAKCALFLATNDANFINGSTIVVDGGATAVHRLPSAVADIASIGVPGDSD